MSVSSYNQAGGTTCVERGPRKACRVVVGLGNSGFTANLVDQLTAAGYEVTRTAGGEEARRQAVRRRAHVMVVPVGDDLLATAKVAAAAPKRAKVVLVAARPDAYSQVAAGFLGAAFAAESDGVGKLVRTVTGR